MKKSIIHSCIRNFLKKDAALIVGNGINRFTNADYSWTSLLQELLESSKMDKKSNEYRILKTVLENRRFEDISITEIYDIIRVLNWEGKEDSLQTTVANYYSRSEAYETQHRTLVDFCKRNHLPLLTTNFDKKLEFATGSEGIQYYGSKKNPVYQFSSYYGHKELGGLNRRDFSIWHIHGSVDNANSIRSGIGQYIRLAGKVIECVDLMYEKLRSNEDDQVLAVNCIDWLKMFFCSKIAVLGFAFGKDEIFMRWLLLERAKFLQYAEHNCKEPLKKKYKELNKGIFLTSKEDAPSNELISFLKCCGIEVVVLNSYEDLYLNLWKDK